MIRKAILLITLVTCIGVAPKADKLTMATTTTVTSSGLLNVLIPAYEQASGDTVTVYSIGTGKALRMGRKGEVDLLITHAPSDEIKFVNEGYGIERIPLMKNDFIVAGPASDPAKIHDLKDVKDAFRQISETKSLFYSRADDSGTHKKELSTWESAGIIPLGNWYFEHGAGMAKTLVEANHNNAYVLVDRSTWLTRRSSLSLKVMVEGDPMLVNPYSAIIINPEKFNSVSFEAANRFVKWLKSDEGRAIILGMEVDGEKLFKVLDF